LRLLLPIISCLALATPAFAQTVDADGAARLTADLSRYVGKDAFERKILAVAPEGGAYRLIFDVKPLVGLLPAEAKVKFEVSPFSVLVKPLADGKWDVVGDSWPSGSVEAEGPKGRHSSKWMISDGKFTGVYDPALAAFPTITGSLSGTAMASRDPESDMQATTGAGTFQATATAAAGGGVDLGFNQKVVDFVENIQLTGAADGARMPVTLKAASLSLDGAAKGYRTRELLDLLAFGVANADEAKLKANQEELKKKLFGALPFWNRFDGTYHFGDFEVAAMGATFGAKTLSIGFGMDGAVKDAEVSYKFAAAGLSIPAGVLPEWSATLLPTDINLNLDGVGFDFDGIVKKLVDNLDLNKTPPIPDEVGGEIAANFLAKPPKLVIAPSSVKNGDTQVSLAGEVSFVGTEPDADVTVDVAGFDKMVENLQTASKQAPELSQYLPMALIAKGFAKTQPDGSLRWKVVRKADGSVSVNSVQLKGPDAPSGEGSAQ
jgi:hypothetical protein